MYSDMSKRMNSTPSAMRQLARDLGLADAGGAGEQEAADRLALIAEPGARHLDGGGQRLDRLVLAEDHQLQVALEVAQHLAIRGSTRSSAGCAPCAPPRPRSARTSTCGLALAGGLEAQARAGLVDHVDGLVRQVPVVDVPRRRARPRPLQRLVRVGDAVVLLERGFRPLQDLDRSPAPKARRRRSSGSGAPARGPSRRCRGIPGRWSNRCSAARRW